MARLNWDRVGRERDGTQSVFPPGASQEAARAGDRSLGRERPLRVRPPERARKTKTAHTALVRAVDLRLGDHLDVPGDPDRAYHVVGVELLGVGPRAQVRLRIAAGGEVRTRTVRWDEGVRVVADGRQLPAARRRAAGTGQPG